MPAIHSFDSVNGPSETSTFPSRKRTSVASDVGRRTSPKRRTPRPSISRTQASRVVVGAARLTGRVGAHQHQVPLALRGLLGEAAGYHPVVGLGVWPGHEGPHLGGTEDRRGVPRGDLDGLVEVTQSMMSKPPTHSLASVKGPSVTRTLPSRTLTVVASSPGRSRSPHSEIAARDRSSTHSPMWSSAGSYGLGVLALGVQQQVFHIRFPFRLYTDDERAGRRSTAGRNTLGNSPTQWNPQLSHSPQCRRRAESAPGGLRQIICTWVRKGARMAGRDAPVDDYLAALPAWQAAIAQRVRDLVHEADAEVEETIKRTRLPYFVLQGNICAFMGTKDHLNVFVYDPIAPDPSGLVNQGHANKTARAIQLYEGDELDEPGLVGLFRAVIANNRAGRLASSAEHCAPNTVDNPPRRLNWFGLSRRGWRHPSPGQSPAAAPGRRASLAVRSGIGRGEDPHGEQARVAGVADRDGGHRDAGGHLHDREQRVHAVQVLQRHRDADHRQRRERGQHARQVGRSPGPGDDHLQAAGVRRRARRRPCPPACGGPRPRPPRRAPRTRCSASAAADITGQSESEPITIPTTSCSLIAVSPQVPGCPPGPFARSRRGRRRPR